jgi:hypothetical protein
VPDSKSLSRSDVSGSSILRLARSRPDEARRRLRALEVEAQARACLDVRPEVRCELLMLVDHPEDVVPLLPEAEVCITARATAMSEGSWLLEMATAEQRQACFDLDCWNDVEFLHDRALEWLDGLVEAGRQTVASAVEQVDLELWILTLRELTGVAVLNKEDEPPPGAASIDGVVYWLPRDPRAANRVLEIAHAAFEHSPSHYWRIVYGILFESPVECEEYAYRWRAGRLADLGFPERGEAMRVYRPLEPEAAPFYEDASQIGALVGAEPLPKRLEGTLLGEALSRLPAPRAADILYYVLAVANALAIADRMRLSEAESIPRALEKAARGIELGLRELAKRRELPIEEVLDRTLPLDLFRIGVTLDPALRDS